MRCSTMWALNVDVEAFDAVSMASSEAPLADAVDGAGVDDAAVDSGAGAVDELAVDAGAVDGAATLARSTC